ncbi:MAG TPA: beta-propeller fold lactonase family protein [Steroidobacteraceae bacterium]|nr:beta-propeller fold lactonase family protein [Steroidobacteraceae bacterium]
MRIYLGSRTSIGAVLMTGLALAGIPAGKTATAASYEVFVSNEQSGDVTVISGEDFKVLATIPAGKRPRGIHAGPDGRVVYVALSGTPIEIPQLDAKGNPILRKHEDSDDDANADKSADGIGVIDVAARKLVGKINAGSDPEEFAVSKDGTQLYVSNEDVKTASVIGIHSGKVEHIIPVAQEPEGVATSPDGKRFYVTCEAGGDIYVIDTSSYKVAGHFRVAVRPRSVAFLPNGSRAFIPSETTGQLNVVDTDELKILKVIDLPQGSRPMSVKVSPDGRRIYVSDGRAGTISVLDAQSHDLVGSLKVGQRPWGIIVSPDGHYLFSANGPSNDVSVVDLTQNKEITRVHAGQRPWGITIVSRAN